MLISRLRWLILLFDTVSDDILVHPLASSGFPFWGGEAIRDRT